MSGFPKNPEECLHITIDRLPPEKKKSDVLNFNGRGILRPVLQCSDCGSVLYVLNRPKKKDEG